MHCLAQPWHCREAQEHLERPEDWMEAIATQTATTEAMSAVPKETRTSQPPAS